MKNNFKRIKIDDRTWLEVPAAMTKKEAEAKANAFREKQKNSQLYINRANL